MSSRAHRKKIEKVNSQILARALLASEELERHYPRIPPRPIHIVITKVLDGKALNPVEREILENVYTDAMYRDLRLGDVLK
jgi:hypothetical protein